MQENFLVLNRSPETVLEKRPSLKKNPETMWQKPLTL
jgi:hypothetical protein